MRLQITPAAVMLSILVGASSSIVSPVVQAQTPPAIQRPGPWQPLALVNPKQPVQVNLINNSAYTVEYGLTTTEGPPRELDPGQTATFRRLPLPAYLLINPTSAQVNLKFNLAVTGNLITVTVQTAGDGVPGDSTLNVNDRGGIYIY